ncbi:MULTISPECIES: cupredoxin domain-containing protein [unclassified Pseudoalteromonas]|uniref:cupredoxin domain-containing protein n=1 Tax=unclassified Pseudoalteromonas TaxID=194690 RepID=UPI000CF6118E|nr:MULTISPECIES: cupredoxin domain-containing protein [unclassified Pseudoalteromonas]MBS3796167.1 cupredoxin domain-containing protein [Pseudoalteromonas sp. BDTF-M6]
MIIINILGLALIVLIVWWFWLYKPAQTVMQTQPLTIEVKDGVYTPAAIQVAAHQTVTLNFLRKDQSPCSEMLLIPDLGVSEQLELDKVTPVTLTDLAPGEYPFHCQMQMYRGTLTVV